MGVLTLKDMHDDILQARVIGAEPMAEYVAALVGIERLADETDAELFQRTVRWYVRNVEPNGV